jgi:2-keto-4-pentenoate hydratase/2-oxohepta-3-ene-1,7-dioic acid hydratase in catechol pathway
MAKWLRYIHQGTEGFGTLDGDAVAVHEGDMFAGASATGQSLALADVSPCVPVRPGKIVALWNNSRSSAEKQKLDPPSAPLYFIKTPNTHLAPEGIIPKPASYDGRVIFEAELGVVIGRRCRDVTPEAAEAAIFGYTCVNDVTALQLIREDPTFPQWSRAKNFDGFTPLGPCIATDIDAGTLAGAAIRAELQGRERQNYPVSDLFFSPLELVSLLSRDMTLEAGDVISCGTGPGAVPMKPGDRIEISIEGIGTLGNTYGA